MVLDRKKCRDVAGHLRLAREAFLEASHRQNEETRTLYIQAGEDELASANSIIQGR